MRNNPIGVFDSGIGGLTVVREIVKLLPNESIIYIGDTARVPYGPRSKEVISKFSKELAEFLLKKKVKFLVVACNTISATSLPGIIEFSPVPVLGVIEPTVEKALKATKNKKIGVIGTTGTINSRAYNKIIASFDRDIKVTTVACPLFVPIAEEGLITHPATRLIAEGYLKDLKKKKIDTLILGCTHYPILKGVIQEILGSNVKVIDSAKPTAQRLKKLLEEKNLLSKSRAKHYFYVTDAPAHVSEVAGRFFGKSIRGNFKKVSPPVF